METGIMPQPRRFETIAIAGRLQGPYRPEISGFAKTMDGMDGKNRGPRVTLQMDELDVPMDGGIRTDTIAITTTVLRLIAEIDEFKGATPFDTPRLMTQLVEWTRENLDSGELLFLSVQTRKMGTRSAGTMYQIGKSSVKEAWVVAVVASINILT